MNRNLSLRDHYGIHDEVNYGGFYWGVYGGLHDHIQYIHSNHAITIKIIGILPTLIDLYILDNKLYIV